MGARSRKKKNVVVVETRRFHLLPQQEGPIVLLWSSRR